MSSYIAMGSLPHLGIPSPGLYSPTDHARSPTNADDGDDLINALHSLSFCDLDIPITPSPPEVDLILPGDWNCHTAVDVAQRLAGDAFDAPDHYHVEVARALQSRCRKIIPYLNHDIRRDRLPKFSEINLSGKNPRQTTTERHKLKTLEYLYAKRLQVAHLYAVKRASPAMWGYLTQLTAAIQNDCLLRARVLAARQPLVRNPLALTIPLDWECDTVEEVITHVMEGSAAASIDLESQAAKCPAPPHPTRIHIRRDRLPTFSKYPSPSKESGKVTRHAKPQLVAMEWLYGTPLGFTHLNVIERECTPLFEYIRELGRVVKDDKYLGSTTVDALVRFTLATLPSNRTARPEGPHSEGGKHCAAIPPPVWTRLEGGFGESAGRPDQATAVADFQTNCTKRKVGISYSDSDVGSNDSSVSQRSSSFVPKRPCRKW